MRVGSLFSGIGGFDLGFERAGMTTEFFVEQTPFCQEVLRKHWPDVPIFGDIQTVDASMLPPVDLLCGGFPCQDISAAGQGAGLDGKRSGLWAEFHRLIGELRPRYVVVENVPLLRSRGLGRILREMAALGYDAEWDCIPASAVGAPHRRDRIWIVGYPNGDNGGQGWSGRSAADGSGQSVAEWSLQIPDAEIEGSQRVGQSKRDASDQTGTVANADGNRREAKRFTQCTSPKVSEPRDGSASVANAEGQPVRSGLRADEASELGRRRSGDSHSARSTSWATEPDVGRVAYGVPARVDRLRALGNALVPQIAEEIGWRIMRHERAINLVG
jgi:DNA (cytosine-5)-methyltransferase 1